MSSALPSSPPSARSYLAQQLNRFRLAVKDMRSQLEEIDKKIKEVQTDLVCVISALEELEEEESRKGAA